ncbi:hypothetical protein [Pasteuria penetrans]|uniref:hypothetical protein n=1 Tax=Pasteuria penetrans TaxID=86005 RepID=UPI000FA77DFF|nr:hypothetical protein [Pasteuria penetrans]
MVLSATLWGVRSVKRLFWHVVGCYFIAWHGRGFEKCFLDGLLVSSCWWYRWIVDKGVFRY